MDWYKKQIEHDLKIVEAFKYATPEILPDINIECEVLQLKIEPRCPLCANNHSECIRICEQHQIELENKL